ncbi:MAG: hypothetical protein M1838_005997 [Thelocarpon superellum]|nr:MAG: hypothetical protein M1838_005997 [Thelocarpon superellum]
MRSILQLLKHPKPPQICSARLDPTLGPEPRTLNRLVLVRHLHVAKDEAADASIDPGSTRLRLRRYQEDCIQSVLSHLRQGHRRLGVSLATGSGKTVIFTQLIDRITPPRHDALQSLILVHRRELVEQAFRHCRDAYPTKTIEIEMGTQHASGQAEITVASVQSIGSGDRMAKFDPARFKLVLVDEAHHIVAPGYMKALKHFGLLDPSGAGPGPALVGVSATLSRFDGLRLGAAIDHIVYHKDYVDMIHEKWLSDVIFTTVRSHVDLSHVRKGAHGDFQPGDLSRAVNTAQTNELTVRAWLARAGERRSTMVFCVDVAHVRALTDEFRRHGIDARYVTGRTAKDERAQRLDDFRAGTYPVLLNCGVFTEGTDIPNIDCVVLARPTKSRNLLVQMIGRGMRLHPGKKNCHVLDLVASLTAGIVTIPTLFGLDPSELVEQADVPTMMQLEKRRAANTSSPAPTTLPSSRTEDRVVPRTITMTDYDSVVDLIEDTSGDRHIRTLSALAWVQVGPDKSILNLQSGDYITIARSDAALYEVRLTRKLCGAAAGRGTKSPYMKPRVLAQANTFADAVHAADTYAQERLPWHLIANDRAWRKAPASKEQVAFLNRLRPHDDALTPDRISKGRAGDMITKIKHGARGQFEKMAADRKRQQRQVSRMAQDQAMTRREEVQVGPVPD